MARVFRVCSVVQPVEVPDPKDDEKLIVEEQEVYYHFLHWGLTAGPLADGEGKVVTAQWTVAICEHIETGIVFTFIPALIKFVGYAKPSEKIRDWGGG